MSGGIASWVTAEASGLNESRAAEAAAFRHVCGSLRDATAQRNRASRAAAVRKTKRLWHAVLIAVAHPESPLPMPLRQGLATLGTSVLAELDRHEPDLAFLLAVNEQILAGLAPYH
ncbi:flagellar biosynthesis regulator FlaF [Roseomonas sp. GC11]|uniref:flagellar biosynthesis regulator FlaF n=1 Tax=Roseomonas sp. GC11 TaxID=2950546 RepID=UPI002108A216|nr:flagellar biosynthesis regulator FlaF [Roseomonas sp. GC11]MCQ4161045.1 flagellar biosynthesis regulator FlaF [Roseomonas sp. GC11]